MKRHAYFVYILHCSDNSYYTGMTNDYERRLEEHHSGLNPSCYTYTRRPLTLLYCEEYQSVYDAINREKQIKGWSKKKKEALIRGDFTELQLIARNKVRREEP